MCEMLIENSLSDRMCLPWLGSSSWLLSLKVRMLSILCLALETDRWPADALRILTQWGDQLWYLQKSVAFVFLNKLLTDTLLTGIDTFPGAFLICSC